MASKLYNGSCHCGRVKYQAEIDLSQGTGKCNCTMCRKARSWSVTIQPSAFKLLAGEDALSDYSRHEAVHHLFCKHCGVRTFGRGYIEEMGGAYVSVALGSLDDVTPEELIAAPVRYFNGLDNAWMDTPSETRHL